LQVTLARLTDAARIAALSTIQENFMPDAIKTRCKFRVVSVEQLDGMAYDPINNTAVP